MFEALRASALVDGAALTDAEFFMSQRDYVQQQQQDDLLARLERRLGRDKPASSSGGSVADREERKAPKRPGILTRILSKQGSKTKRQDASPTGSPAESPKVPMLSRFGLKLPGRKPAWGDPAQPPTDRTAETLTPKVVTLVQGEQADDVLKKHSSGLDKPDKDMPISGKVRCAACRLALAFRRMPAPPACFYCCCCLALGFLHRFAMLFTPFNRTCRLCSNRQQK